MTGTSLAVVKTAIVAVLEADSTLSAAGVKISYSTPVVPSDLKSIDGDYEAIWLGDTAATVDVPVLTAGTLHSDENYRLDLVVQVLKPGSLGTQQAADERAAAIFGRVETVLANNVDASITDPARVEVLVAGWNHVTGILGNGQGHGSRFEVVLDVTARLTPT